MLPSPDNRHQILRALCRAPCILSMQLCVLWRHKHETSFNHGYLHLGIAAWKFV